MLCSFLNFFDADLNFFPDINALTENGCIKPDKSVWEVNDLFFSNGIVIFFYCVKHWILFLSCIKVTNWLSSLKWCWKFLITICWLIEWSLVLSKKSQIQNISCPNISVSWAFKKPITWLPIKTILWVNCNILYFRIGQKFVRFDMHHWNSYSTFGFHPKKLNFWFVIVETISHIAYKFHLLKIIT